jgi:hypothetical protein
MITSAVDISIHVTSPLFGVGGAGLASSFFTSAAAAGLSGVAAGLSCASVALANTSESMSARNAQIFFITSS